MPLLNYTTKVAAGRTAGEVQTILATAGARAIMLEYDGDRRPTAIAFKIETAYGLRAFTLPVNPLQVQQVMKRRGSGVEPRYHSYDQAERVAWRILKDWIEAQLALIATEMVSLDQVMLPYMQDDGGRTIYELYVDRQLALPATPS